MSVTGMKTDPVAADSAPTPVAVTLTEVAAVGTTAFAPTVRVSVEVARSEPPVGVTGVVLNAAVTPAGRPVTVSAAVELGAKEPPAVTVKTSVALVPCSIERAAVAAVTVSVGALSVTLSGTAMLTVE